MMIGAPMAEGSSTLASLDPRLHHLFDVGCMSLTDLAKVMDDYVAAVETGRAAAQGWPAWINPPSKVGQVAAVKVWARELADEAARRDILVNAACPGSSTPAPRAPGSTTCPGTLAR
jgi:carbonyl reductase 1